MCDFLSKGVDKGEADTKAMVLGIEDDGHSFLHRMMSGHISMPEEREPDAAPGKGMEDGEILAVEMGKL